MSNGIARLLLLVGSFLVAGLVLEVAVRVFDLFADSRAVLTHTSDRAQPAEAEPNPIMVPHPFLGYSGNPAYKRGLIGRRALAHTFDDEPSRYYWNNRLINAHGFPSQYRDYVSLGDGFHIGIFGGSVAEQLATIGGEALIERLEEKFPERRGRIRVLNFSIGGFKQPQQLIGLILARLQGIRLDVVVNLDGYNEVALSGIDVESGHDPIFPTHPQYRAIVGAQRPEDASATLIEGLAEVIGERRAAEAWRSVCEKGVCGSELVRAVIGSAMLRHDRRAAIVEEKLQQGADPDTEVAERWHSCLDVRGDASRCWQTILRVWEQSSLSMAAICEQMGVQYLHFLQPNQYVKGSKTLSPAEKRIAWTPKNHRARNARNGYMLLRNRLPSLRAKGVAVTDLTTIFADESGDIYVDACCHFNQRGTRMLAEAIAREIR